MGSLNKVMLIGNLGRDPEIRYTNAGSSVANYSIATTDRWTDRQGQKQERTEWHDIVAFDRLADLSQNYLRKGSNVFIEGRLQTRSWEDNEGQKKYRTEVVANVIQFLDKGWSDNGNENQETELSDNNPLR
jgi:single-strand DNA-binding protein